MNSVTTWKKGIHIANLIHFVVNYIVKKIRFCVTLGFSRLNVIQQMILLIFFKRCKYFVLFGFLFLLTFSS